MDVIGRVLMQIHYLSLLHLIGSVMTLNTTFDIINEGVHRDKEGFEFPECSWLIWCMHVRIPTGTRTAYTEIIRTFSWSSNIEA